MQVLGNPLTRGPKGRVLVVRPNDNEMKPNAEVGLFTKPSKLFLREPYVPILQDARYFFCSAVSLSILTFMQASFSLAIAMSIVSGTG